MKQKLLSILALLLMAVTGAWADTTVTWTESDMSGLQVTLDGYVADNNTIKGITVTASGGGEGEWFENDINNYSESSTTITFTSSVGNIKSIAIKANDIEIFSNPPGGWTLSNDFQKLSWSGDASSTVSLLLSAGERFRDISEIVFTIEPDPTYIVAGNYSEIFGSIWDGTYEANKMTKGDDGKYTKTYNVEDAFSDIQLKVVKDGQDWIGDETGFNVTFSMKQAGSFTVTLDPNANPVYVTVTGDNVVFADTEYAINYATGMQNGTVTGPDTAKEDDEVTLTITPAAGYVLESISVTGVTTENAVEVTDGKFTMPAEDVNVIATFKSVTYSITVKEGTEDAANWTVSPNPAEAGQTVTISYTGTKKVKSIKAVKKAVAPAATDLSTISADYEAKDGETLTGTLANNVKISIADGATVTLKDVNITNLGDNCDWAGINCPGDATLVLAGTNTVCAGRDGDGYNNYPGICIAPDKTLTIQGDGTLTAYSNASKPYGAGIGGGYSIPCGNIVINSGNITATGGGGAAGIGGRSDSCGNITINGGTVEATGGVNGAGIGGGGFNTCGTITISGGTVEATGGDYAAGIGGGSHNGSCGTITITSGVTQVTATKGSGAPFSIGNGYDGFGISVTIEDGANVIQN